ncbi:glutathione binding-like protein [Massilia sp. B-10]|nr:glutathione binding-like protein [Massilia sp. B-10]
MKTSGKPCAAWAKPTRANWRGERELLQFGAVIDAQLAYREWITGKALSLADLALAPSMMYIERGRLPLARFPHLMAWFARIQALLKLWQNSTLLPGKLEG